MKKKILSCIYDGEVLNIFSRSTVPEKFLICIAAIWQSAESCLWKLCKSGNQIHILGGAFLDIGQYDSSDVAHGPLVKI